jgi:diguanylate cyclase (GGDEF)-like protein
MAMRVSVRERAILLWHMTLHEDYFERDELFQQFYKHGSDYHQARMEVLTAKMTSDEKNIIDLLDQETSERAPILRSFAERLMDETSPHSTQSLNQVLTDQIVVANLLDSLIALQQSQNEYAREHSAEEMANLLSHLILLMVIIITAGFIFAGYVIMTASRQSRLLSKVNHDLEHLACHDSLTGLPNRIYLLRQLKMLISSVQRNKTQAAVMFVDVDNFKAINDTFGHDVGDQCLKELSTNMSNALRGSDTLGRLGGDEFLIVITDVDSAVPVIAVAHKLLNVLDKEFNFGKESIRTSASIGVCLLSNETKNAEEAIMLADKAMYQAKKSGKNQYYLI